MIYKRKHKGAATSLQEIILVIAIVVLIAGATLYGSSIYLKNARYNDVENTAISFIGSMENSYINMGMLEFDDIADKEVEIKTYLLELEDMYLTFTLDIDNVTLLTDGFLVQSKDFYDAFGMPYTLYFCTTTGSPRVLLISSGEDMKLSYDTYATGDFSDDLVFLAKER